MVIPQPRTVPGLGRATSIVFGRSHILVLVEDGTLMAWGENNGCQVGNAQLVPPGRFPCDQPDSADTPVKVTSLANVVQIAASAGSSGALLRDGTVMLWGGVYRIPEEYRLPRRHLPGGHRPLTGPRLSSVV